MVRVAAAAALAALAALAAGTPVSRQVVTMPTLEPTMPTMMPALSLLPAPTITPGASRFPRVPAGVTPGTTVVMAPPGSTPGAPSVVPASPSASVAAVPSPVAPTPVVPPVAATPAAATPAGATPAAATPAGATPAAATPAGATPAAATPAGATPAAATPAAATPAGATPAVAPASPVVAPASPAAPASVAPATPTPVVDAAGLEVIPDGTPMPSPSPLAPATGPAPVCFPASTRVELEDGSFKTMESVKLGDRVRVSSGGFSDVFMFTHKLSDVEHEFVSLKTNTGASLSLTSGHYLYVNGELSPASVVKAGDALELGNGSPAVVVSVGKVMDRGLFNPQTAHGDIIVDGIRASTYTTAVAPGAAHAMLTPLRSVYERLGLSSMYFDAGAARLAGLVGQVLSN